MAASGVDTQLGRLGASVSTVQPYVTTRPVVPAESTALASRVWPPSCKSATGTVNVHSRGTHAAMGA